MRKRIAKRRTTEPVLSMTPMIDVTFLLLIFFLSTLKFRALEGKLESHLPPERGVNSSEPKELEESVRITIEVVDAGTRVSRLTGAAHASGSDEPYRFEGRRIQWRVPGRTLTNLADLEAYAERVLALDPGTRFELRPGAGSVYAEVVAVLDLLALRGVTNVSFVAASPR